MSKAAKPKSTPARFTLRFEGGPLDGNEGFATAFVPTHLTSRESRDRRYDFDRYEPDDVVVYRFSDVAA